MEIQTTSDNAAESMQVLQVLLELVHPQGGTVQIAQGSDNIQIQAQDCVTDQLQNIQAVSSDLGSEGIVIAYNGDEGTLGSIQNRFQITQQQLEEAKANNPGIYDGSQLSSENVVFEISGEQAESMSIPISTASTAPQSTMVEIPIINTSKNPSVKEKKSSSTTKTKTKKSLESLEEKYQFECIMCKKLCKSQRSLQKHMEKELRLKPHICETCGKRFKNVSGLQNHQKLHTGVKPYKCETCDVAFANRSTYNYHVEKQHSDKVYICQCSKTFKTKACLRAHLKNHTFQGPKRYKCQFCNLRLKTKHYKDEHERIHTDERPYKCRQGCEKAFRRSGARNDHERTVHLKANKEPCQYCGHLYDKREMKNHEMVHTGEKPFQCPYCESKYTQRKVLNKHIRRKHPDQEIPQPPPKKKVERFEPEIKSPKKKKLKAEPEEEPEQPPTTIQIQVYKCMYCVKLFNNIDHLTQHEKTHLKEHHYECSTCGKQFKRPEGLTRHEGKHAGGFRCYTCGKVFSTLTKMQEHHREHFFKCTLCKYKFHTKEKLDEHMKKHVTKKESDCGFVNPTAQYECKFCQKTFLRKVGLKEHERIHLERVKCPLCDKMFVSYYLQKHLRTHSGDHPYTCSLCPNRHYTTPNALRTHTRRRHPVQKIEIKHKRGTDQAQIQITQNPQQVAIAHNIIVEGDLTGGGDAGVAVSPDLAGNLTPAIKNASDQYTTTDIHLPYAVSDVIHETDHTATDMDSGIVPQSGTVAQLVTQESSSTGAQLVTQESSQVTQLVTEDGIQVGQLVGQEGAQVVQLINEDGTPFMQFHSQEEVQMTQLENQEGMQMVQLENQEGMQLAQLENQEGMQVAQLENQERVQMAQLENQRVQMAQLESQDGVQMARIENQGVQMAQLESQDGEQMARIENQGVQVAQLESQEGVQVAQLESQDETGGAELTIEINTQTTDDQVETQEEPVDHPENSSSVTRVHSQEEMPVEQIVSPRGTLTDPISQTGQETIISDIYPDSVATTANTAANTAATDDNMNLQDDSISIQFY